jgi:hypothetical protein
MTNNTQYNRYQEEQYEAFLTTVEELIEGGGAYDWPEVERAAQLLMDAEPTHDEENHPDDVQRNQAAWDEVKALANEWATQKADELDRRMDGNDWDEYFGQNVSAADYAAGCETDNITQRIAADLIELYPRDYTPAAAAIIASRLADYALAELGDRVTAAELNAVMTIAEIEEEYGVVASGIRATIERGSIPARKSAGTWLVRRVDADARWG